MRPDVGEARARRRSAPVTWYSGEPGVVAMERVFHRIKMIQVAPELVEAMDGRQKLVAIA